MAERKATILIADDESELVDVMEAYLKNEGYTVLSAGDGRTVVELALSRRPDLILLDLNLPRLSGLDAFHEIRLQLDIPVIMLTAQSGEVDRVVGLELGADDYVSKPYSPREVVARVKTVLRRRLTQLAGAVDRPQHDLSSVADLTVDRTTHEVTRNGTAINLTPTEYKLLGILLDHPGQVFTRGHLIDLIAGDGAEVYDRTLDRHIGNLRAKIEPDAQRPRYILTVFGAGYKLADLP
jgi:DNA-binding response OmpR family regulator